MLVVSASVAAKNRAKIRMCPMATATTESAPKVFTQTANTPISELDRWQQMTEAEAQIAYDMTLRNELSGGTEVVRAFEEDWREFSGLKHAMTVNNGTAAVWCALYGLGVGPGDEVICPTFTWIGSISPVPMMGARPVFVESDTETMQIDPEDVRRKITPKTKAIVGVHMWGWLCDMDALMAISEETGVPVIEDCAHAHGATYRGKPSGSIGHAACWSLQGSKAVSGGEAGVFATDNAEVFERAALLGQANRIAGVDLLTETYKEFQPLGTGVKFRSHPVAIGIASVQLKRLAKLNSGRKAYVEAVEAGLADVPGLDPARVTDHGERGGYYAFPVHYRADQVSGAAIGDVIDALKEAGAPSGRCGYIMLHRQPYFAKGFDLFTSGRGVLIEDYEGYKEGDFPISEKMVDNLIFLPSLTDPVPGAAEEVVRRIKTAMDKFF